MVERLHTVTFTEEPDGRVTAEVDTNKHTYEKAFATREEAEEWVDELLETL